MGWLITLGILVLLGCLPLRIDGAYDAAGPRLRAWLGPVPISLYPRKSKPKKQKDPKEPKKKSEKKAAAKSQGKKAQTKGGSLQDFLPLVKILLDFLKDFVTRKLRVTRLELKVILAGGDPCDLGLRHGKAWIALGNLWPQLERVLIIQKRDVEVECDFVSDNTLVIARVVLSITLGRLLGLITRYGFRLLAAFLKIQSKRKGGASA